MDFVERVFGVSPDGGSGLLEFLLFLVPIAGIVVITYWRKRRTRVGVYRYVRWGAANFA
jgi:hypothetical protein